MNFKHELSLQNLSYVVLNLLYSGRIVKYAQRRKELVQFYSLLLQTEAIKEAP